MDKMREEFEVWAISCEMCTYLDDDEYRHQSTEWAWRAWKSSRAALCVELPQQEKVPAEMSMSWQPFYKMMSSDVIKMLEDAGVSYK